MTPPASCPVTVTTTARLTIDEDSEAQEVQVALATTGVPADVWVPFGQEHGAALEATASQVGHHLSVEGGSARGSTHTTFLPKAQVPVCPGTSAIRLSLDPSANKPHLPPSISPLDHHSHLLPGSLFPSTPSLFPTQSEGPCKYCDAISLRAMPKDPPYSLPLSPPALTSEHSPCVPLLQPH